MGLVQRKWKKTLCRIEDGVFYGDDSVAVLTGTPETGYSVERFTTVSELNTTNPDGWFYFDETISVVSPPYIILAGGGSWEGEGFVALVNHELNEVVWILHLAESEAFTKILVDSGQIVAVAHEYPVTNEFTIPMNEPTRFRTVHTTNA